MPRHTVRPATEDDIPWMVDELRESSAYVGTKKPLFPGEVECTEKLKVTIRSHVAIVSVDKSGEKTGMMVGVIVPHHLNSNILTLTEAIWWVPARFRKTGAGAALLVAFTEIGSRSVDMILVSSQTKTAIRPRSFEFLGYKPLNSVFIWEAANAMAG